MLYHDGMRRHELTDEQWKRLEPLLPPAKPRVGRPNADHRRILNAIRWRLRTGAPWRDLPERYGSWKTVDSRFRRWQQQGLWDKIFAELQADADAEGHLDWTIHLVDGRVVRAPPARCGSQKGADQALGRSRGGGSTKIHLRAEGRGRPITFCLTGGERHEQTTLPTLLESGAIKRRGRGRPRRRPERVAGDKGYSSRTVRRYRRRRGIGAVIPRRANEPQQRPFDREAYRERNRIERLINRLKQNRAIATRYDKLAVSYHAMLTFACILIWL
jgi:transposase